MTLDVLDTEPPRGTTARLLVGGLTGQVGRGLAEAAAAMNGPSATFELAGVVRRRARANLRFDDLRVEQIVGDVVGADWLLGDRDPDEIGAIDAVVNLAGIVDWTAPQAEMDKVNYLGAMNGLALARRLSERFGRPVPYLYASTAYVAGTARGIVPEALHPADPGRNPYELSKWLAEHHLTRAAARDGHPVLIARIGGVIGSSATRSTTRRSSLYQLVAPLSSGRLPVFPVRRDGRVDILPRDVIGEGLVRLLRHGASTAYARWRGGTIVHLCAGDYAPTMAALLAVLRSKDTEGRYELPRLVSMPDRALRLAENVGLKYVRWNREVGNRLHGLRYVSVDRIFERSRLLEATGGWWPTTGMEQIIDIAFGFEQEQTPEPEPELPMGRFI